MTIDLAEAQTRLRKLAAERPDYVYEEPDGEVCVYFDPDGQPSCIVGHALESELRAAGVAHGHYRNGDSIVTDWFAEHLDITEAAFTYLSEVQTQQDSKVPWGRAVAKVDHFAYSWL